MVYYSVEEAESVDGELCVEVRNGGVLKCLMCCVVNVVLFVGDLVVESALNVGMIVL